ncbi:MAG TPA: BREX system P-loop protein BrxC [bacterium]|nr:BREX system P-loop protein BrxC [bacterium]
MKIKNLFAKDIFRPINGVVKADQRDEEIIYQELSEYVVTRELNQYLHKFFTAYLESIDRAGDPNVSGKTGVWVSGFFGSGKSHFIKILSYVLSNLSVSNPATGESRNAVSFMEERVPDAMLYSDMKRAADTNTDVILFNIDSKADARDGRQSILAVFMKVFNQMQGFSSDPHIAEMERYLSKKGKLKKFHEAFKDISGSEWKEERDAYLFRQDELIAALSQALGMSEESAKKWFEDAESKFSLTVEGFAKSVKDYLDKAGRDHRIVFLVDEVGQFIGKDGHLMLSLQTITENLGSVCKGKAWVIVTSQEDIDRIIGELRSTEANDFSKIQGRFVTRLSLSSSNTDEVIQARLLEKTEVAKTELATLYETKGDIIKNQLSFTSDGPTLRNFKSTEDFAAIYPFAPYQFQLLQKIFEQIRKVGVTGLHLARGERSMLDAFQTAAKSISDQDTGVLVPLYQFYPSIESFLEGVVKSVIDQAADNPSLEKPFDIQMLQTLFLIRYVDLTKPNVDNLVTLLIDKVDADRLELKRKIQESLQRLEKETLINRSGDNFFFLTNEERDVSREIKGEDVSNSEETKELNEILFEEVFKADGKHRYSANNNPYTYSRLCDGQPYKGKLDNDISIEVITPVSEDYPMYNEAKCVMRSMEDQGRLVIKLWDDADLERELRTFIQTDKYIRKKSGDATESIKSILRSRQDENRERKTRIIEMLNKLISGAEYYAKGNSLQLKASTPAAVLQQGLDYLIQNIYNKLDYIEKQHKDPVAEIKAILTSNDVTQLSIDIAGPTPAVNPKAISEIRDQINLMTIKNAKITLGEITTKLSKAPCGWPEYETAIIIAKLFRAGEITLLMDGSALEPADAVGPLTKTGQWKQITILKKKKAEKADLTAASQLGKELFGQLGPEAEDPLFEYLFGSLKTWQQELLGCKPLADTGNYPGKKEINDSLSVIQKVLAKKDTFEFIKEFVAQKNALLDAAEDVANIAEFFKNQRPVWERLLEALDEFKPNKSILEDNGDVRSALSQLNNIRQAASPYALLKDVDALIQKIRTANESLVADEKAKAAEVIRQSVDRAKNEFKKMGADTAVVDKALKPVLDILEKVDTESGIPNIGYMKDKAAQRIESALDEVVASLKKDDKPVKAVKEIKPSAISKKAFLETEQDVEDYVSDLKATLMAALKENTRVRLK